MSEPENVDAKVVLLGAASVGKTCILARGVSNEFDPEVPNTIGACFMEKQVVIDRGVVNLQIWDTAGQERFRTLAPMYYRGATVAMLVYSLVDEMSIVAVQSWADELKSQIDRLPILYVVGNKCDLEDQRTITMRDGEEMAQKLDAHYCEVSAKSGRGIEDLFTQIAEESFTRLTEKRTAPADGVQIDSRPDKKKKKRSIC
jgi:small GTP-binding protein